MLRVRTRSDREQLRKLATQAKRLALTPGNKQWRKHRKIALSLTREIENMLIFEDYRIMADGSLRRIKL